MGGAGLSVLLGVWRVAALVVVLFLPGYLACDLVLDVTKRKGFEVLFLQVLISLLATSLLSFGLACAKWYSLRHLMLGLVSASLALLIFRRVRGAGLFRRYVFGRESLVLCALLCVAGLCFCRPHEYVGGGWDPGVYLQTGASVARRGGINYEDPFFADIPADLQDAFVHRRAGWRQRFPGFRLVQSERLLVNPQFYHLFPCLLAVFYGLGGAGWALMVNPVVSLLGVAAVYLAARVAFGRRAALIAAVVLAGNGVQIWFARFPTAEMLTQFLLWSGLYLLGGHMAEHRRGWGWLGATCIGGALLARVSAIMFMAPLALVLVVRCFQGHARRDIPVILWASGFGLASWAYGRWMAWSYFDPGRVLWILAVGHWKVCVSVMIGLVVLAFLGRRAGGAIDAILGSVWARGLGAAIVLGLSFYAFFIRPGVVAAGRLAGVLEGDALKRLISNSRSFRDIAWFFTVPGLFAGVAGMAAATWRGVRASGVMIWSFAVTACLVLFHDRMVEPFYMFALRRFVPVVVPSIAVFAGITLSEFLRWRGRRGLAACAAATVIVVGIPLAGSWRSVMHTDYRGALRLCGEVRTSLREAGADIVVCEGTWLAAPLHFLFGETALGVSDPTDLKYAKAERAVRRWLSAGKNVCYLTKRERPALDVPEFVKTAEVKGVLRRLERTFTRVPRRVALTPVTWRVFRASRERPGNRQETSIERSR